MPKRICFINMTSMSKKDQERFLAYLRSAGGIGLKKKIRIWNKYAKNVNQHVFFRMQEVSHS